MTKKLGMLVLAIIGVLAAYWFYSSKPNETVSDMADGTRLADWERVAEVASGWTKYESDKFNYSILHPKEYSVEPNGNFSITFLKQSDQPSFGPANFVYISVVEPDQTGNEGEIYNYNPTQFKSLQTLKVGESVSLADTDQVDLDRWFTYTLADIVEVDGYPARMYENTNPWEFPPGTTENRYIFEVEGSTYILGYYTGGEGVAAESVIDPREAYNIISTFRLK